VTEVRRAEGLAQLAELGVVADRDDQVAVAGGERLVGVHAGVGVAHPERDHPARGVRAGLVHHPGQGGGHQVRLHELALAGRGPVVERGEDGDGGMQARDHVEHRDARAVRRPVGRPGHAHKPGHGLHHEVVTGQVLAASGAESADRGVHDPRVHRAHRVVVQPVLGQPARLEVLHEHVGPPGQFPRRGQIALVAQVEPDRALVPVDGQVVGGQTVFGHRRRPAPGVVALRALHLDHVGAEVTEQHRAIRPGQHP